ncbi:MAG: hypothetical protein H0X62_01295 [Bacteroidetes bacterium]|nr:hypothetical protein [Bacteroidota bacterium]
MKTKNSNVIKATTPYSNSRINRDKTLYAPNVGLVDIAQASKKYVKSVFGSSSREFKLISGISFKNQVKK